VAEGSDLILSIGRWVLEESCTQGRKWQDMLPPEAVRHLAVNISARQLQHDSFVDDVKTILLKTGLSPDLLVLEITESVLMHNIERTLERLHALKALGLRLALDDFGTGYSALSYLHQFPFDILKIDRSFVGKITNEASTDALVRTIVAMGHSLGLKTVAEGIEHTAQLAELRYVGCNLGQGFLFAKPASAEEVSKLLAAQRGGPTLALASTM
jgi:EAL domain-containing protein (putative c-di-GMP-specific phosphodiesterase class I)